MERMSLNITLDHRAYVTLCAHVAANRGNADGTCGGTVSRLILEHLKEWRVSRHTGEGGEDDHSTPPLATSA